MQGFAPREDGLVTTLKLFDNISRKSDVLPRLGYSLFWLALFVASLGAGRNAYAAQCTAANTITANVVVLDNPTIFNRLGAQNPNWISYALERDVVYVDWGSCDANGQNCSSNHLKPITQLTGMSNADLLGKVELRPDKRPRPLVVRSVEGQCLTVNFTNLLTKVANPNNARQGQGTAGTRQPDGTAFPGLTNNDQVAGRCAGFHASGTELVNGMEDDGSMVGANDGGGNAGPTDAGQPNCGEGLAAPGETRIYELYTPHEGAFIINSYGATLGSEQSSGNLGIGMFGALNVQPKGARLYRSQVTEEEMRLATVGHTLDDCDAGERPGVDCNPGGQPIVDYDALYPNVEPWISEGKAGLPVLRMVTGADGRTGELVHSDINAIIAGPDDDGTWRSKCPGPQCPYPLESVGKVNPQLPDRIMAYREFTSQFHDEQTNSQVFPNWYNHPVMRHVVHGVKDQFMINYGSGGIGSEIIANRLRTGPMHDCTDCAYEEFFLASQTVGDPALLVNNPANTGIEACSPENIAAGPADPNACWRNANLSNGPIPGNYALFQEDPANIHHAYTGDHVKYRNTHAGAFEQHIFHFHNHQWLFNPNDDNANYLDAQEIMPGSGHTYELVNGGAGNRNHTVGDAIFHCHFYPHFAQGMWYHQRNHDVYETGTVLQVSNADDPQKANTGFHSTRWDLRSGKPMAGSRAYPDGELPDGSPIPAIVPLPGKPMPQMPAEVSVVAVDRGGNSLLGGRTGPDGIPDSSQAIVNHAQAVGADGIAGTPDDVSPGYPFWLAGNECGIPTADNPCPLGIVGQRMPTPPLDMLTEQAAMANIGNLNAGDIDWQNLGGGWDGGLPRHALLGYTSAGLSADTQNRLDFRKVVHMAQPVFFPETGTAMEKVSMAYQAVRHRPSVAYGTDGMPIAGTNPGAWAFVMNGAAPVPGGPYNDPCVDDRGRHTKAGVDGDWYDSDLPGPGEDRWTTLTTKGSSPYDAENPRTYKIANLQIDAVFNKLGHHYSQERIIILWDDVKPTVLKERPPEPLVMRFNSFDCGKILHANLVPAEFEVDDFQVRTPTDIIGQHIHLPKWDLTTGDGAANGWNYEDGTLSPLMVEERIHAINEYNHLVEACVDATELDPVGGPASAACVVPANTLPGQLGPIDLNGLTPVETLTVEEGADPHAPSVKGATTLVAADHYYPAFTDGTNPQVTAGMYHGARTTIQRILVDPVVNVAGVDRGLGLTFSHDHYGPSTFQQIGLYSTILAEPAGSTWVHNESGEPLSQGRADGGPTSWQAAILTGSDDRYTENVGGANVEAHREFYFEMSDFQHAYKPGTYVAADTFGIPNKFTTGYTPINQPNPFNATVASAPTIQETWKEVVNPTLKTEAQVFPDVVTAKGGCPGPAGNFDPSVPRPCPEAINVGHSSTWVVNYRNEPVGYRVFDPSKKGPDGQNGAQADGPAGDLALAFSSSLERAIPQLNTRFGDTPYPTAPYCSGNGNGDLINCDRNPGDPFTPIMRAYEGDNVKVKIQVGATEEQHQTTIHGIKWLSNGSGFGRAPNSGWRNFQSHGISEQFSLQAPFNAALRQAGQTVDYLYAQDATRPGIWLGTWGLLRTYGNQQSDLVPLPNNDISSGLSFTNSKDFNGVCPKSAPVKTFGLSAVLANDVLPNKLGVTIPTNAGGDSDGDGIGDNAGGPLNPDGGTLVYNRRQTSVPTVTLNEGGVQTVFTGGDGPLNDPTAMMYVLTDDLIPVVEHKALVERDPDYAACTKSKGKNGDLNFNPTGAGCAEILPEGCVSPGGGYDPHRATCPVMLKDTAPVEPLVLRANAGDCIEINVRNRLVTRQAVVASTGANPGSKVYYGSGEPVLGAVKPATNQYYDESGALVAAADVEFSTPPDLAGWQDMMWGVTRRIQPAADGNPVNDEMHFFNNNLVAPGSYVGIHPQLVEYDASRDDGLAVGRNQPQLATPEVKSQATARYYAGHLEYVRVPDNRRNRRSVEIHATPVEFGGSNLLSADRIKQPQKGLFASLVIEPQGATYAVDTQVPDGQGSGADTRPTRAQMTIKNAPNGPDGIAGTADDGASYREAVAVAHKIANLRWADGTAIKNIHQQELGVEGAEDSGHAGFNYGTEPSWFRFKLPPNVPFGAGVPGQAKTFGDLPNQQAFYANNLVAGEPNANPGGDPATPVFRTTAGMPTRMYVVTGASADRDSTFILHGHVWQRDPFVCPNDAYLGLAGYCESTSVASQALGKNPIGKYMGGEEGMGHVYGHWPILFDAGGTFAVDGDYLFRDYTPSGNRNGMFGILRVDE